MFTAKDFLRSHLVNFRGIRTSRKIVVIESDDWGTIRMQSKEAYDYFLRNGYPVNECGYNKFDSLESNEDIEQLLELLSSVKTVRGGNPKFTINNVVANPNFEKILGSGYSEYFYESFIDTLNSYPKSDKVFELYKEGIQKDLIKPQFHGREHLNIFRWLNDLRDGKKSLIEAFKFKMFTVHSNDSLGYKMEYMDTLSADNLEQKLALEENLVDGIRLFNNIWGFSSDTFIAPCFIWHSDLNKVLEYHQILGVQGYHYQIEPTLAGPKYKVKRHYFGEKLSEGQYYLMRNVTFEPSLDERKDWVKSALREIEISFLWNKPAIISSHRVNYIGRIHQSNRKNGIVKLKVLLEEIVRRYPDVEFMYSSELLSLFKRE